MAERNEASYYIARAATARDLAAKAINPAVRAIHKRMADEYDMLAEDSSAHEIGVADV